MKNIASTIDHTILKPEATAQQVDAVIAEALQYSFASVCVNGCFIERVAAALAGSPVKPCAVAGFPLGAMQPKSMAEEAAELVRLGAQEIDFVAPLRYLMAADEKKAGQVMRQVVDAVRQTQDGVVVKVIIESAALMKDADEQLAEQRIAVACAAARAAGCDFVKTSTGFHPTGGATVQAVKLMRQHATGMKVKAAGGIRSYEDAANMLQAGADRLGCSSGVAIVKGEQATGAY